MDKKHVISREILKVKNGKSERGRDGPMKVKVAHLPFIIK